MLLQAGRGLRARMESQMMCAPLLLWGLEFSPASTISKLSASSSSYVCACRMEPSVCGYGRQGFLMQRKPCHFTAFHGSRCPPAGRIPCRTGPRVPSAFPVASRAASVCHAAR